MDILPMNKARSIGVLIIYIFLSTAPVYAQEQLIDGFSVNFGIMSWEQIQRGLTEKPASHAEEYHYRMAREMATMHGGSKKGASHVLVVIDDKKTGKRIDKADVRVTFVGRRGPETVKLRPMTVNDFSGFGEFVVLRSSGPYVFNVSFRFSDREPFKEAKFVMQ